MIRVPRGRVAVTPIFDPTYAGEEYALRPGSKVSLHGEEIEVGNVVHLHIPDDSRERCDQGIIKYVGADVEDLKIGDYVIFSGYVGSLVNVDDERLIIMPQEFCQAVLEAPSTDVAGVYFRAHDGTYYTATYEMMFELLARAFKDAPWHRHIRVTTYAPKIEDYDKLKAGHGG
jgi:co-chaperonin GroES (HSP10)